MADTDLTVDGLVSHHTAMLNGLEFHYVTAGDPAGPPVMLLHGFPEFWYGWRHQIPALAEAGYHVIALDQRGYNLSAKPRRVRDYRQATLVSDLIALLDHLGIEAVNLVGHDFGAAVSWLTATLHPERIRRMAILNVPHHAVIAKHLRTDLEQARRSWYMFAMQLPWVPEWSLGRKDSERGVALFKASGHADTFSDEELAIYRAAWRQPGAWRSMVHWYRAVFRDSVFAGSTPSSTVPMPVHIIWGEQDVALGKALAAESLRYCQQGELTLIPEATHWVQHDAAALVNRTLVSHFAS